MADDVPFAIIKWTTAGALVTLSVMVAAVAGSLPSWVYDMNRTAGILLIFSIIIGAPLLGAAIDCLSSPEVQNDE